MRKPTIDLSECNGCGACVDFCPEVFRFNEAGFVEVIDLSEYPQGDVDEAIMYCPEDCIYWEEQ